MRSSVTLGPLLPTAPELTSGPNPATTRAVLVPRGSGGRKNGDRCSNANEEVGPLRDRPPHGVGSIVARSSWSADPGCSTHPPGSHGGGPVVPDVSSGCRGRA